MSPAQKRALALCAGDGLTTIAKVVHRVRADVLDRLEDSGLISFRPYAREPKWKLTRFGRAALRKIDA